MTEIYAELEGGRCLLDLEGHAVRDPAEPDGGEAEEGSATGVQVCAAVSAIVYALAGYILNAEREGRAEVYAMRLGSARACLHVHGDDRVEGACEAAILGLRQLEGRYGAYLHMECAPD